jgi:hypothetical protein
MWRLEPREPAVRLTCKADWRCAVSTSERSILNDDNFEDWIEVS